MSAGNLVKHAHLIEQQAHRNKCGADHNDDDEQGKNRTHDFSLRLGCYLLRRLIQVRNLQWRVAGRAVRPFWQFIFGIHTDFDGFAARRADACSVVAYLSGFIRQIGDHRPGNQKTGNQHKMRKRNKQCNTREQPEKTKPLQAALYTIAVIEQGGLHLSRRGGAVVVGDNDRCIFNACHDGQQFDFVID